MNVVALSHHQFGANLDLLAAMYRLRRRVFKDRLDWSVSVSGEFELDVYDTLNPTYLMVVVQGGREVLGCVRLLPTTGPNMLANTFPHLLAGRQPPHSERILESSRFCVDTKLASEVAVNGLHRATFILFAAMIETLKACNADCLVTVTDIRMERILRRAGWPLQRLGPPQQIGEARTLAGFLHRSDDVLAGLCHQAGVSSPVIVPLGASQVAA
jgi:acyl homoserine lactone synthase